MVFTLIPFLKHCEPFQVSLDEQGKKSSSTTILSYREELILDLTDLSIKYYNAVESRRHNLATEQFSDRTLAETQRHNVATEQTANASLGETQRHNLVSESLTSRSVDETVRHNIATEGLTSRQIDESTRHNLQSESLEQQKVNISAQQAQEQHRHNVVGEVQQAQSTAETIRHNKAGESNQWTQIRNQIASTYASIQENIRHNKAQEAISNLSTVIEQQKAAITAARAEVQNTSDLAKLQQAERNLVLAERQFDVNANAQNIKNVKTLSDMFLGWWNSFKDLID